ncbi:TPA: type VI secretion system baseplate subunit TssF [Yersinia enterocolitica]|nr:type VI secretion system baseplate subunit TssF [Yersinia enterocolitica]HEN3479972.1 type VI secretion system baseplate subunit TssF [Yersinia enterocolitica]
MNKLLLYYQKELSFLKKHGEEFSRKYPKIARRLGYHHGISEDPHIERLTESFAFLSSRIHQRLDEDLPEVMEALLLNLAPQFLYNYPSSCVVSIEPDPNSSGMTTLYQLPAGAQIFTRHKISTQCHFRTVYPLTIVPATINDAKLYYDKKSSLWKIEINMHFWDRVDLATNYIRFYLNGPANITGMIYTLLCSELDYIVIEKNDNVLYEIKPRISCVGFDENETTLPQNGNISHIHHLVLDYFSFPEKFNFIDINFGSEITFSSGESLKITTVLKKTSSRYEPDKIVNYINKDIFKINCAPIVNLFEKKTEPLRLSGENDEHQLNVDLHRRGEVQIWSVHKVTLHRQDNDSVKAIPLRPLFGLEHMMSEKSYNIFWHSSHCRGGNEKSEENVYIRLTDDGGNKPGILSGDVLSIDVVCTNGDIPSSMNNGDPDGDFDSDIPVADLRITALTRPSKMRPAITLSGLNWRVISQLSLNHVLLSGTDGAMVLREMLSIYNYNNTQEITTFISWIKDLQVTPVSSRLPGICPPVTANGINITVILSQDAWMHPECFLFCTFLDRFLGLHAPVNSFTRVITVIEHAEHTRKVWPVRAGKLSWL